MPDAAYNEPCDWTDRNNRYLSASLHWLRQRLRELAPAAAAPQPRCSWLARKPASAGRKVLQDAAQARVESARTEPLPALLLLAERLGLSAFERDTLLLCAAVELDPALPALMAEVQGSGGRSHPSFALALQAFDEPSWDALAPHRPLRYARLIEINQPGATPLTAAALRADERIVNYLKGLNVLDERLSALVSPCMPEASLSATQQAAAEELLGGLRASATDTVVPVLQLLGRDGGSRLAVATQVCAALNRRLYRLTLESLPTQKAEIETFARLWQRESLLLPLALYVEADQLDGAHPEQAAALQLLLTRDLGLVFVGLHEAPLQLSVPQWSVEVRLPTPAEQAAAWREGLGAVMSAEAAGRQAAELAGHFRLNLADLQQAARRVATQDLSAWELCRDLSLTRLDALAQRLEPKATWDDLVLGEEATRLLRQIAGQVRERHRVYEDWGFARRMNRGLGINALFAGESGTGKTMAAEVIANDLSLHLYRIDLSAVVSKYIGETEKNLRKLFDAAEQGGAILFFDEADALFGKRSEVKDSHDRYANIEINYLLQRMEVFSGLAILATNMKTSLDPAFLRRLRFVVNFQFPGPVERRRMWAHALAPEVPRAELDYERLARFSLSGGNIHSVALSAAFMAAARGVPVSMPLLLSAVRAELRKLDKPVNEAEFRPLDAVAGRP